MPKLPPIVVAVVSFIALLGPAVSSLAGVVPARWLTILSEIVGLAGFLHNWLLTSSLADKRKLAALAEHVETLPKNTPGRGRLAQLLGLGACLALCVGIAGCTPAEIQAFEQVDEAVLAGLPAVCAIADVVDPTGATIICAIVDAAGNILASEQTTLTTPALAAKYVTAHPAPAAVVPALKARAVKRP